MKIQTGDLKPGDLIGHDLHQVYNGLDACLTFEIFEVLSEAMRKENDPSWENIYSFERGMQAPALDMMLRGWLIDPYERQVGTKATRLQKERVEAILNRYGFATWGKPINPRSPLQLKNYFYSHLGLPEQFRFDKGERKVTTNREALEKLEDYLYARPQILSILAARDATKLLSVLETEIDQDGRMRTSYNIAGTNTGRWSSSSNSTGGGTNLQNITPKLRRMFIADKGYKLCYLDLEQAESRVVGLLVWWLLGDATYLDACESGDLHTYVARLVWPKLPWTGEIKKDREIAEQIFYRHFTYRDMAKRGGHGTNYYGTPPTMAKHLKVTTPVMQEFQDAYFTPFSGIRRWHVLTARTLGLHQEITTPLGRRRIFFGRPDDDATLRKAIAYAPQSTVGDLLNYALWRLWKYEPRIELLAQIHDAVVFQYPDDPRYEADILSSCIELTRIPLTLRGRTLTIPSEAKIGWNWGENQLDRPLEKRLWPDGNPNGLVKWKSGQNDSRRRVVGLDRAVS